MTSEQFDAYLQSAVRDYAEAHLKAGDCEPDDALPKAQADYAELLPEGARTKHQHLFVLHDDALGRDIGMLWSPSSRASSRRKRRISSTCRSIPSCAAKATGGKPWRASSNSLATWAHARSL